MTKGEVAGRLAFAEMSAVVIAEAPATKESGRMEIMKANRCGNAFGSVLDQCVFLACGLTHNTNKHVMLFDHNRILVPILRTSARNFDSTIRLDSSGSQ